MAQIDLEPLVLDEDPVQKMNETLAMMEKQPEVVCQLFSAFTNAGVLPNAESYERVIRACVSRQMFDCAGLLLSAAEQNGIEYYSVALACLEASPGPDKEFIVRWAPPLLRAGMTVPSHCFAPLLRDAATTGGVPAAAGIYHLILQSGASEQLVADALLEVCGELGRLEDLREIVGMDAKPSVSKPPANMSPLKGSSPARMMTPPPGLPGAAPGAFLAPPPGLPLQTQTADWSSPQSLTAPRPTTPVLQSPAGSGSRPNTPSQDKDAGVHVRAICEAKSQGREVSYDTYRKALEACVEASSIPEATMILEEMRCAKLADASAYNILLKAHALKGRYDKAEKLQEEMRRDKVRENSETQNAFLDAAARTGRHEKGWKLLEQMMKQGVMADKYSVSLLLKNITEKTEKTKTKRGLELVEKYIDLQRGDADDILFNSLLDACCRVRDIPRLERMLAKMRQFDVKPSPATFGTLLKAYGQRVDQTNVFRVWNDMKAADIGINTVTYGCMLDACVKCGQYEKAEEVFNELREAGQHRNTILFSTMIKSYSKQKKLRKAMKAMEEMDTEGVPLNCVTFNSLIDAAIRCRDLPAATKLLEQMKNSGIAPDLITYSTLIKGFCDQGDIEVALNLLQHLKAQNVKCDEILYNSLLEGCVKSNQSQRGLDLFQEMVRDRVPVSNITFSIMIKLYANAGRLDQAMELVKRMEPDYKVKPSNIVFSCVTKCLAAAQQYHRAAKMLLGLPNVGFQPDQQMYALILPGLIEQKQFDYALEVFEALCKAPVVSESGSSRPPAVQALGVQLFEAVGNASMLVKEKARTVLQNLRAVRAISTEQDQVLERMLGPPSKGWMGQEFVPGVPAASIGHWGNPYAAQWEAAVAQHAAVQQFWAAQWGAAAEWSEPSMLLTPMRNKRADENASPNVVDLLLQNSAEKDSQRPRRAKGKTPNPKTPVKMAPVVAAGSPIHALNLTPSPKKEQGQGQSRK
jgi:pentatricopeptide repeat protein